MILRKTSRAQGNFYALGNVISGNTGNGIEITGSVNDEVKGNIIGLDGAGATAVPNGGDGDQYHRQPVRSPVGSPTAADRNFISSNHHNGIGINSTGAIIIGCCAHPEGEVFVVSTDIEGNYIGTDLTGEIALGNGAAGVHITDDSGNFIGAASPGAGNLISGNSEGILIEGQDASFNFVQGNTIGPDALLLAGLGTGIGVHIAGAPANTIGGTEPGQANIIGGNTTGVLIEDQDSHDNVVEGNLIGEFPNGGHVGNAFDGVRVQNSGPNTVGGPDPEDGNIIAHNGGSGVGIVAIPMISHYKPILSNRIYDNGGLGIDLEDDGVTLNDDKDPDTGANDHQNYPVLASATEGSGQTTIEGSLNSTQNTGFKIQFFASSECDPSGYGEGAVYLGDLLVTTDSDGNKSFSKTLPSALGGDYITATATDALNNTSEFSACVLVSGGTVLQLWGSLDCMGELASDDAIDVLAIIAGLAIGYTPPCPATGNPVIVDGVQRLWGDWNCDGSFDEQDMLAIVGHFAGTFDTPGGCPDIGQTVETQELP